jgi:hypothetical protein
MPEQKFYWLILLKNFGIEVYSCSLNKYLGNVELVNVSENFKINKCRGYLHQGVTSTFPFENINIDLEGPFAVVAQRNRLERANVKTIIAFFVCHATTAIYLA